MLMGEQAEEEIVDIQCQTLAKTVTMNYKEVENCPPKHAKKWDSGIQKELDSLKSRDVFDELTKSEAYHTYWKIMLRPKSCPHRLFYP